MLRKRLGREPKVAEVSAAETSGNQYQDLTEEDVIRAYDEGLEV
jgi:hypothetical protein